MKQFFRLTTVALISGGLFAGSCAFAQQSSSTQGNSTQSNQDQYTGVSTPPSNDNIVANEPLTPTPSEAPAQTPAQTQNKPSAAVPAQQYTPTLQTRQPASAVYPAPATTAYSGTTSASSNSPNRYDNTDFGMITQVPDTRATQQVEAQDAQLENRTSDPSFGIVSVIPAIPNALSPGTNITVRLLQPLSSSTTPQGTPFRATIVSNVYRGSQLVIPAGSELRGVVTDVHTGRHLISHATLRLTPQFILLPDGKAYRLDAETIYTSAPYAKTTDEGAIQPTMHLAKDSAEYGSGAGLGALTGSAFGPAGALIGSAVGVSAVSAHMLLQAPNSLTLPRNAEVIFSLTQPMQLTPTRD